MGQLEICVCVKSIPDPRQRAEAVLDPKTGLVRRNADALGIARVLGPLDRNALEEALRIKETRGGRVTALTMDAPAAAQALSQSLALGADQAVLLTGRELAGADTLATARALAVAVRRLSGCDLVLCGAWSYHGNTGQVGPQLAALLDLPHVSFVSDLQFVAPARVRARSEWEGRTALTECDLPLLVTVSPAINVPRGVSLMGIVRAREKQILQWGIAELGLEPERVGLIGSPSRVVSVTSLPSQRLGQILDGDGAEATRSLVRCLRDLAVL